MIRRTAVASAILVLAISAPARAQGKSQSHKKNPPPSRSDLTAPVVLTSVNSATPFAWVDDASLLEPGAVAVTLSASRWQGTDVSEVDVPVVDATVGLTPRVQLAATVPRVVGGSDPLGAAGGMGTSYFSAKIAVRDGGEGDVQLSITPTLEVLGRGVIQSATPDQRRLHFGLPVSASIDRGAARFYAAGGYFSRGVWFTGGGAGIRATTRGFISLGYSRSWRRSDMFDVPLSDRSRNDIIGGASFAVTRNANAFGSVVRTIATQDENGAGMTLAAGVSFVFAPASK